MLLNHSGRGRRMRSVDDEKGREVRDMAPGADEVLSGREEGELLRSAVLQLPEDLRFTVTAHFWGGLAVKEVAKIEGITTVAIRKRLHKAFALLEASLDEDIR